MSTCVVSGTLVDASETGISNAVVRFKLVSGTANGSATNFFAPEELNTVTASNGAWSLTLSRNLSGMITIDYPPNVTDSTKRLSYSVVIPNTSTATFNSLVTET